MLKANALDLYLNRNFFIGSQGSKNYNGEETGEIIEVNKLKLGNVIPLPIPLGTDPDLVNWFGQVDDIVQNNPGKGFYLCYRTAMATALAYARTPRDQFGILNPSLELDVSSWTSHTGSDNRLSGVTANELIKKGQMEPHKVRNPEQSIEIFNSTIKNNGVILLRHSLVFPQLGYELDNKQKRWGHWISLLDVNTVGGILQPYGVKGFFANVDNIETVLKNTDFSEDSLDENMFSFFINKGPIGL